VSAQSGAIIGSTGMCLRVGGINHAAAGAVYGDHEGSEVHNRCGIGGGV